MSDQSTSNVCQHRVARAANADKLNPGCGRTKALRLKFIAERAPTLQLDALRMLMQEVCFLCSAPVTSAVMSVVQWVGSGESSTAGLCSCLWAQMLKCVPDRFSVCTH